MAPTTIRIAHDADFAPLAFHDGRESRGLVVELLTDVLGRIGRAPEFMIIALAGHEAALRGGEVDAALAEALGEGLGERLERKWLGEPADG